VRRGASSVAVQAEGRRPKPEPMAACRAPLAEVDLELEQRPNSPLWRDLPNAASGSSGSPSKRPFTNLEFKGHPNAFGRCWRRSPDEPLSTERADAIPFLLTNLLFREPRRSRVSERRFRGTSPSTDAAAREMSPRADPAAPPNATVVPLTLEQDLYYSCMRDWGHVLGLHTFTAVRVPEVLARERLERAASDVARRHPAVRARLLVSHDEACQEFRPHIDAPFEYHEVSGASAEEVNRLLSRRADERFDLAQDCPLRIVVAAAAGETAIELASHHLFLDLPSLQHLLTTLLGTVRTGELRLPEETPSYLDYARLQAKQLDEGFYDLRVEHWRRALEGAEPSIDVGTDRPTPTLSAPSFCPFDFDVEGTRAVLALVRERRATPFAVAAASVYASLREVTGQADQLLGIVTTTRRPPFGETVGQFADFAFLRQAGVGDPLGADHIRRVQFDTGRALSHFVPTQYLRRKVECFDDRNRSRHGASAAVLNFLPAGSRNVVGTLAGLGQDAADYPLEYLGLPDDTADSVVQPLFTGVVLFFWFAEIEPTLRGVLQYDSGVVTAQEASAICAALVRIPTEVARAARI
jgi:hypothetical protein